MKEFYVTVASGMCNRLFAIASALRVCRVHGHRLAVFWTERTGRSRVPYVGSVYSGWPDYFEPLPGVAVYAVSGHPRFQDTPVALDRARFGEPPPEPPARALADESPAQKFAKLVQAGDERLRYMSTPRIVDPSREVIVVRGETYPFGMPGDPMERYLTGYLTGEGVVHLANDFLRELGDAARTFRLQPALAARVDAVAGRFARFRETWGIHVRGTDLARRSFVDRAAAVNRIIAEAPPDVGVFVASDAPLAWLARGERVIEYLPAEGEACKYENSVAGNRHGLVDLYALARCDRLYGSAGSSFSMMAWLLSGLDEYEIHS